MEQEQACESNAIMLAVAPKTLPAVAIKVSWTDYQQLQSVGRDLLLSSTVVQAALLAAPDAADGLTTVEERNRPVMLELAVLDN